MKTTHWKILAITAATLTASLAAHAKQADPVLQSCFISMASLDDPSTIVKMDLEVSAAQAVITTTSESESSSSTEAVQIVENTVRANLEIVAKAEVAAMQDPNPASKSADPFDDLNPVERYIAGAMTMPMMGLSEMNAGFDLTKVASAKVFLLDVATNMGQAAIVVGKDGNGKVLGSFLGGMIVSPCLSAQTP
jgi:hypothetical protein